jgi:deoxyhypusine monooxygenase
MGAISTADAIPILEEFLNDPSIEVVETCQIALDKIKHDQEAKDTKSDSIYTSIDPAPPAFEDKSTPELKDILLNPELPLFKRYRAMFALRNRGDEESVLVSF